MKHISYNLIKVLGSNPTLDIQ